MDKRIPEITDTPSTYEAARIQAEKNQAAFFIDRLTRKAKEFVKTPVTSTEAPVVTPD